MKTNKVLGTQDGRVVAEVTLPGGVVTTVVLGLDPEGNMPAHEVDEWARDILARFERRTGLVLA